MVSKRTDWLVVWVQGGDSVRFYQRLSETTARSIYSKLCLAKQHVCLLRCVQTVYNGKVIDVTLEPMERAERHAR